MATYIIEVATSHAPAAAKQSFKFTNKRKAEACIRTNRRKGYVVYVKSTDPKFEDAWN